MLLTDVSCRELCHGVTEGGADLQHGCDLVVGMRERDEVRGSWFSSGKVLRKASKVKEK